MRSWSGKTGAALALALVFVMGSSEQAVAQGVTSGAVSGFVQDSSGTPIGGASIEVRYEPTGFRAVTATNSRGYFLVQGLEPGGPYLVSARAIGYRPERAEGLRVSVAQTTRQDFRLATSTVQVEDIVVETEAEEIFSPSRQGSATTVGDSALRRLPTLNRDFADFVKLTPQVGVRDGDEGGVAVAGQNNRFNTIQVDGATVNDRFGLGRTGQTGGQAGGRAVGLEAVKEYQVLLAPYDVRQGNFTGALINAVTKSGTNDFAGTAFFFNRNDALAGGSLGESDFSQSQFGASFGGPIIRDQAHFFLNAELSRRNTPAPGPYFGSTERPAPVAQADFDRFVSIMEDYGLEAGNGDLFERSNPLTNLLARFDVQLGQSNRLIFRYGYNEAEDDNFSRSTSTNNPIFDLSTFAYRFTNKTHNPSVQLFTNFANGSSNEFRVSFQSIRDRRAPTVVQPLILVENIEGCAGADCPASARLQSGSEQFSQGNELDQDFWEITNNFTKPFGAHLITIGTRNEFYKVRNLFAQSSFGVWRFNSLDDFEDGIAENYLVSGSSGGGVTGETVFNTYTLGFYLQDQWTVNEKLNVTAGLRADIPVFNDQPVYDPRVIADFGPQEVPSGKIMLQPRIGFNYDMRGARMAQLRGGIGLFAGAPAFVWMSNAYANTGLKFSQLTCQEGNTPAFSPNLPPPLSCLNGDAIEPGGFLGEVDLIGEDTKFPRVLRANLGFDRDIGAGFVATIEGLYTKGVDDYFIVNRNLDESAAAVDAVGRTVYGGFNDTGASDPAYVNDIYGPSFSGGVYELLNTGNNYSWSLTGQLQKRFAESFSLTGGYTYSEAKDVQSFTSSRAISNWRNSRTYFGSQLEDDATIGSFSRPHRIVIGATYTAPWKSYPTDISLTYVGQSGQPYTYLAGGGGGRGDLNADGTNTNDPIYIPTGVGDPNMIFSDLTAGGETITAAAQATAFDEFISGEACLEEQRGQIMARNSCRNPWQSFLDMSIRQSLPSIGGRTLTLEVGIFNLLNLLDKEWGQVKTVGGTFFYQEDPLQQVGFDEGTGLPVFTFDPNNLDNRYVPTSALGNSYQVQVGVRAAF